MRYQSFLKIEKIEKIEPLLLEEARADLARLRGAHVLFTPDLCLAEAREFAPADPQVLPLSFVPSEKTLQALVEVPSDALVGVVADSVLATSAVRLPGNCCRGSRGCSGSAGEWRAAWLRPVDRCRRDRRPGASG